jgi:hypothetical protein
VSGEEEEEDDDAVASLTTTFSGTETDWTEVSTVAALLGLGSLLGATSETVAVTAGVVDSTELAVVEVLDVLTILSDYTHISSVFLSSFQYILYIVIYYLYFYKIT